MVSLTAAKIGVGVASKGKKEVGELYQRKLGYNFVDLVTKLALFYIVAYVIAKYMEAVIYFQGGLTTIAGFFGIQLAQADKLPIKWVELFVDTNQQTYSATPTAPGQFNPPGWDRPYDYGTLEHQQEEPHLFPKKQTKFKFWDFVNAIAVFYIGWEAYKYYENGGRDFLTIGIFTMIVLVLVCCRFQSLLASSVLINSKRRINNG